MGGKLSVVDLRWLRELRDALYQQRSTRSMYPLVAGSHEVTESLEERGLVVRDPSGGGWWAVSITEAGIEELARRERKMAQRSIARLKAPERDRWGVG